MSQEYPGFSSSKFAIHCTPMVVLLSSILMNGNMAEVYALRMMRLLAPV
jgi:hypothetical protein